MAGEQARAPFGFQVGMRVGSFDWMVSLGMGPRGNNAGNDATAADNGPNDPDLQQPVLNDGNGQSGVDLNNNNGGINPGGSGAAALFQQSPNNQGRSDGMGNQQAGMNGRGNLAAPPTYRKTWMNLLDEPRHGPQQGRGSAQARQVPETSTRTPVNLQDGCKALLEKDRLWNVLTKSEGESVHHHEKSVRGLGLLQPSPNKQARLDGMMNPTPTGSQQGMMNHLNQSPDLGNEAGAGQTTWITLGDPVPQVPESGTPTRAYSYDGRYALAEKNLLKRKTNN